MDLNPVSLLQQADSLLSAANKTEPEKEVAAGSVLDSFGNLLSDHINNVNQLQKQRDNAVQTYAVGGDIPLHQVMLSMEKAGTAMDLAVQVRNKLLQAYQELNRIQV